MAGLFEVFTGPEGGYSFRLVDSSGDMLATSGTYATKEAVAAAIALVREIAGTGLIHDRTKGHSREPFPSGILPAQSGPIHNGNAYFPSPAAQPRLRNPRRAPANV